MSTGVRSSAAKLRDRVSRAMSQPTDVPSVDQTVFASVSSAVIDGDERAELSRVPPEKKEGL